MSLRMPILSTPCAVAGPAATAHKAETARMNALMEASLARRFSGLRRRFGLHDHTFEAGRPSARPRRHHRKSIMTAPAPVTAGLLVIGDEILSGRTKDKNIGYIAEYLTNIGIDLKEVRVVSDDEKEIVDALNALRQRYTYVFTTGGIGPTHDDITADSVAEAFGVGIDHHPEVVARFRERFQGADLN